MSRLKEIWKDPVWSKVIAQGIIVTIGTIASGVYLLWNKISLTAFLHTQIYLYWILIGIGFILLFNLILSFFKSRLRKPTKEEIIKRNVMKIKTQLLGGVRWEWDVYFYAGMKVYIQNLTSYCPEHNQILQRDPFGYELKCPFCETKVPTPPGTDNIEKVKLVIISLLKDHVEKLKEVYKID